MSCPGIGTGAAVAGIAADERQSLEELRNTVINLLQGLVDQGVITREKADQMVKAAQAKAAADAAASAKSDEGAVRVPYVPQIIKDEIAKQVAEEVKPAVVADVVKDAKTEKWGVPAALARMAVPHSGVWRCDGANRGHILRQEQCARRNFLNYYAINQAGGFTQAGENAYLQSSGDRDRMRGRLHFGVESDLTDSISTGFRLATGNTTDSGLRDSNHRRYGALSIRHRRDVYPRR